jgi:hypothetical protein
VGKEVAGKKVLVTKTNSCRTTLSIKNCSLCYVVVMKLLKMWSYLTKGDQEQYMIHVIKGSMESASLCLNVNM